MAKLSVGGDDDSDGPIGGWRKRSRTLLIKRKRSRTLVVQRNNDEIPLTRSAVRRKMLFDSEQEDEADEKEEDEEEDEEEEEEEEEESEEEEEVEDEEGFKGGDASVESNRDGSISIILTDPEVLDCSVCFDSLKIPVYQCEYGHIACSSCCIKLGNKCSSCSWPIGNNRCRAIEKVLESAKILCQYANYGCKETVNYGKRHDHEETCLHAPYSCPLTDCNFCGSHKLLSRHFSHKHPNSARPFNYNDHVSVRLLRDDKFVVLQQENDGALFILNNSVQLLGNAVAISWIGQRSSRQKYSYDIIARNHPTEDRLLTFRGFTEYNPGQVNTPPSTGFLLIPSGFFGPGGKIWLELCIYKD